MIVIVRAPGGMTQFYTLDKIYCASSPMGAFCDKPEHAFQFGRVADAEKFMQRFLSQWPGVKVWETTDA